MVLWCRKHGSYPYFVAGHGRADSAVAATLHSCHADIVNKLNFPLLYPWLNQTGVLPVTSDELFHRPLQSQCRGININNLIYVLKSREQLDTLIGLLRQTADEAGETHEKLATLLQEKFEEHKMRCDYPGWLCAQLQQLLYYCELTDCWILCWFSNRPQ